jgi:Xaa-Pro aminopeptidase
MSSRLSRLREKLSELKLDALVVSDPHNLRYLSGFAGTAPFDALLLISAEDARVATDSRYWESAEATARGFSLVKIKRGEYDYPQALADFAHANRTQRIGFEADHVPFSRVREWQKAARKAHFKWKPTEALVEKFRAVKDETELAALRHAVQLTDEAFAYIRGQVKPGMTEKQTAWLIECYLRERGGMRIAFELIVASGPHASHPHAEVTDRAFQTGEPITIDIGVMFDHYNSDLTRTICLGQPSEKFSEVYALVLKALGATENRTRAGLRGKQVDNYARRVIEKGGYGEYFGHGTGHGVGLAVHELPRARKTSQDILEPCMTLTVEPGIYIPGWGGVRIEDLVVIRNDGVEVLSQASKEPIFTICYARVEFARDL